MARIKPLARTTQFIRQIQGLGALRFDRETPSQVRVGQWRFYVTGSQMSGKASTGMVLRLTAGRDPKRLPILVRLDQANGDWDTAFVTGFAKDLLPLIVGSVDWSREEHQE